MGEMTYRERKRLGLVKHRGPKIDPRLRNFIVAVYRRRAATQKQLAWFLGCHQSTVHRIVSDK